MMFLWTLLLAFVFSSPLMASFENNDNHRSGEEIIGIQICGERCSGTNFLESLIKNNFPKMHPNFHSFGWKHFLWWFGTPLAEKSLNPVYRKMDHRTKQSQDKRRWGFCYSQ